MYFKESYLEQAKQNGHHKGFHITKEEFNDFCKWMYAFDEVPQYKVYLLRMFGNKKFLNNSQFNDLFISAKSIDDLYDKTKPLFEKWSNTVNLNNIKQGKYKLENYSKILEKNIVYINISHFISYLNEKTIIERNNNNIIQYKALENIPHLIEQYYYKPTLLVNEYKDNGKLYNNLKTNKLEDALLYEIAMRYLHIDKTIVNEAKTNVAKILNSEIKFNIEDYYKKYLYQLIVPFNKIESLAVLIQHKTDQQTDPKLKKTSFLGKIHSYLKQPNNSKDIDKIAKSLSENNLLKFEDLNTLNSHIINGSVKFSRIVMALEKFFIVKNNIMLVNGKNRIVVQEIKGNNGKEELLTLFEYNIRNIAFHFGIPPDVGYEKTIANIEKKFIAAEIKAKNFSSFDELTPPLKGICRIFLAVLHHELYKKTRPGNMPMESRDSIKLKRKQFEKNYYEKFLW